MENFKSTYGPMLFFFIIALIVAFAMTSCGPVSSPRKAEIELLQTEGIDRLIVEECGMFQIVPSKGIAIEISVMSHSTAWKYSVYKLNSDSTRYIMCK